MANQNLTRIFDLHYHQLGNYPKPDCLVAKIGNEWKGYSCQEFIDTACEMSRGLLKLGIKPGDKVAMIANNRPEWHITDLAILQIGAVVVPIYPTITADDYSYIMNDAGAKAVFVSDEEILGKVNSISDQVDSLTNVYTFDQIQGASNWTEVTTSGAGQSNDEVESIMQGVKTDDLATLIYTSGTTGKPKGVMLSHKNLVSNVVACKPLLPVNEHGTALSFLPLCHVYERMVTYLYIYTGVSIYYAESMETIGDNLREVKPQVFTAVPRLLEKVYDKIIAKGNALSGIKKGLFFWALGVADKYDPQVDGGGFYNWKLKMANKLIFSKWREALGGNAQAVISGSAALQPKLARVFLAAQIPVLEGYGLSETSPVLAVNCTYNNGIMIGSVGRVLDGVEIKIAEDGEILAKGPNVMKGYYNKPELTAEVIDSDGWFHTGDIGKFDGDFLKITDRKKEIFKTSGGKYIAPQMMENKFKESGFIEQIMVVGEGEKHPAALVQPEFGFLKDWCTKKGIEFNQSDIVKHPEVIARYSEEINKYNEGFAKFEKIKKFELVGSQWSVETGEMTPTLKMKRKVILEKYKELYNNIYKS